MTETKRVQSMRRGKTERQTCDLNGWGVGTILRGHEAWANGKGTWTTIRITALGEASILARCILHEATVDGHVVDERPCNDRENVWTLHHREWVEEPTP